MRGDLEKLRQKHDLLVIAPSTKADAIRALHARVDDLATAYPETRLMPFLAPYMNGKLHEFQNQPMGFLIAGFSSGNPTELFNGLCGLMPQQVKAGIEASINAAKWPDGAMIEADREKELEKLNEQIAKLEADDQSLQTR